MLARNVEVDDRLLMDTILADLVKGGRWEEGAYTYTRVGLYLCLIMLVLVCVLWRRHGTD